MGQALEMCVHCDNKRGCDTCTDLHNWIMEHLEPKQEWVRAKDRLPNIDQKVLVYDAGDETEIHVYHFREDLDGLYWDDEGGWAVDFENVTHWMPLPEPPERDDE